ncbi:hypothetical protein OE88DRAFT_1041723 [Heliocybe sulcata]|uniref:Uncharacterized protein n=1 Tax=Heliocybe sulcata TaxID=5364 RepID=A0A5C3MLA0_9AGAM|nr:hypothetical protein OE88DRAFT_1041723 [Heliocybe sulcata]
MVFLRSLLMHKTCQPTFQCKYWHSSEWAIAALSSCASLWSLQSAHIFFHSTYLLQSMVGKDSVSKGQWRPARCTRTCYI